jgi:hypothetical protein
MSGFLSSMQEEEGKVMAANGHGIVGRCYTLDAVHHNNPSSTPESHSSRSVVHKINIYERCIFAYLKNAVDIIATAICIFSL